MFESLVASWWRSLGRIRSHGPVGGAVSLRTGFESLKMCTILSWLPLLLACSSRCELSAVPAAVPAVGCAQLPAAMVIDSYPSGP